MARCRILLLAALLLAPAAGAMPPAASPGFVPEDDRGPLGLDAGATKLTPIPVGAPSPHAPSVGGSGDCGTGRDARSHADSVNMTPPASCAGAVSDQDPFDWYRVVAEPWTTFEATLLAAPGQHLHLCLTPDAYPYWWCESASDNQTARIAMHADGETDWRLVVVAWPGEGSYQLDLDGHGWTLHGDCGGERDVTEAAPLALAPGDACVGSLNPRDDPSDPFTLHLEPGEAVVVSLAPNEDADFDLCVRDAATQATVDCSILPLAMTDRVLLAPPAGGDYLIQVEVWSGAESYELRVDPAGPVDDCGTGGDAGSHYVTVSRSVPLACSGALDRDGGDRADAYLLAFPEAGASLTLSASGGLARACAYAEGETWATFCTQASDGQPGTVEFADAQPGTWTLLVTGSGAIRYDLAADAFVPDPQDDCGVGGDATPRGWPRAAIAAPAVCEGTLGRGDRHDGYAFEAPEAWIDVTVESEAPLRVCLNWACQVVVNGSAHFRRHATDPAEWILDVHRADGNGGDYRITIVLEPPFSDCGTGRDAGDDFANASPLAFPVVRCEGRADLWRDMDDWYALQLETGRVATITVESNAATALCVYAPSGAPIECSYPPFLGPGFLHVIHVPVLEAGAYRVLVQSWEDGDQPYLLSVMA